MFLPGDKVKYVGTGTFRDERGANLGIAGKRGEVIAKIAGEPNGFVVEFGDDSYIVSGDNLAKVYVHPEDDSSSYKPRRRRDPDLDEE